MALHLTTVTRTQGANAALKDGTVTPDGAELDLVDVPVLVQAFRRMVRGLEFDVCEMALTTYLTAREHGVAFTALPVFLVRGFHHGAILASSSAGIAHPKDLEGRAVGVSRGWTVTTGVWARAVLADEYGVDLDRVTWVLSGDEHVEAYRPPGNVVPLPPGDDLRGLLEQGRLAAAIGVESDHPGVAPLIPDAGAAGVAALHRDGFTPINHLVVVRDALLDAHPELGPALFTAFARAKRPYLERLRAGAIAEPTANDRFNATVLHETGADPLPYGIGPNRAALERLVDHAVAQHILDRRPDLPGLFAAGTRDLEG